MNKSLIIAINPGSTSTKLSVYDKEKPVFEKIIRHSSTELNRFNKITDQLHFRKEMIMNELTRQNIDFSSILAIVGRGGLMKPVESGVYRINDAMKNDLINSPIGEHASNLGALIVDEITSEFSGIPGFIVDPVVVDELQPVARLSGHSAIPRLSIFHALNQKSVARLFASENHRKYEDLNLIVAHMGGGISVGAHLKGKVIDVNNALSGDGPFSPERTGGLPSNQLAELCFSGTYTHEEIKSMLVGKGGMIAYLGTNDFREICERASSGDITAQLVIDAEAYQVSKEIGSMATVLKGEVDAIILTGGLAFQNSFIEKIKLSTEFIAGITVYPGEYEMQALVLNTLLAIDGKIEIKEYL
ncbi:MAG TPA: butyrate kinase [Bacteroidales bacterium]|nr:butyrate kinase [Bacteroidales bacterium]HOU95654.1 butyrate kinase [Bacteroidales bacterium]HQG36021.1 butyrate kinase [Bacteroidales bacterium]HQG53173.1 butyrate kinase [Bacteroidales bacterium]HQJ20337.1 butyrate kinase [Bacteroidales bacterium]